MMIRAPTIREYVFKKLGKRKRPSTKIDGLFNASPAVLRYPQFFSWDLNFHFHSLNAFSNESVSYLFLSIYQNIMLQSNN